MNALLEIVKFNTKDVITASVCRYPGQFVDECDPDAE